MKKFDNLEVMYRIDGEQGWIKVKLDRVDRAEGTAYVFMVGFRNPIEVDLDEIIPVEVYEELKTANRLHRVIVVLPKPYKYNCKTHSWETKVPTKLLKEIELEDPEKLDYVARHNGDERYIDALIYSEYIIKYGYEGIPPYLSEIHETAAMRGKMLEEQVEFLEYHTMDKCDPSVCYETSWGTKVYAYIKTVTNITLPALDVLHDADKVVTFRDIINQKTIILGSDGKWKELTISIKDIE